MQFVHLFYAFRLNAFDDYNGYYLIMLSLCSVIKIDKKSKKCDRIDRQELFANKFKLIK